MSEESSYPTGPLLHAWDNHPELGPLILRNFSNSGDAEQVCEHLLQVTLVNHRL